jgi:hypothetical protein
MDLRTHPLLSAVVRHIMTHVLWFFGAAIAIGAIVFFVRSRITPTYQVGTSDFARVLAKLSLSTSNPVFAAFMFSTPDRPGNDAAINIQFSLENGRPGFDWVLLGPRNIADQDRFLEFARSAGFEPHTEEMNGVRYLRVQSGDLAALCSDVVTKMYGLPQSARVAMIVQGFEWAQ